MQENSLDVCDSQVAVRVVLRPESAAVFSRMVMQINAHYLFFKIS